MVEADRQHSMSGHVLDTAMAAAGAQLLVQVSDRFSQPSMVRRQDRPPGGWVTQAVQDRDALGRPQHHIKGRDGVAAVGAAQQLASGRVSTLEHRLESGHRCGDDDVHPRR